MNGKPNGLTFVLFAGIWIVLAVSAIVMLGFGIGFPWGLVLFVAAAAWLVISATWLVRASKKQN
jgi:hypothetical protein